MKKSEHKITKEKAANFWARYFDSCSKEALDCHHMTIDCMVEFAKEELKNSNAKDMAITFRVNQSFKFPGDESIYYFVLIDFTTGDPVIFYTGDDGEMKYKKGYFLSDLIKV